MLRDSRSYEVQIIDAVRAVNKALGGTYGTSSAIYKNDFNQYEVQLIDAIKGIGRTLSGHGFSLVGGGGEGASSAALLELSKRVSKLESESFFRLVDGNVTLKAEYQNLWVPGWLAAGGIGNGGGGGGVSYLRELSDVYHDDYGVLNANGGSVQPGDTIVYNDQLGWVAAPITVSGVVKKIACGSYNNLTPDANGLVSITNAVVAQVAYWCTEHITVHRDYGPNQGTKIATIGIDNAYYTIWAPTSGGSGGSSTLSGLTDVTISNPSAGQALVYRGGIWVNESVSPGTGLYLGDLENVTISGVSNGQILVYRDGYWVNEDPSGGGGGGGSYSSGTGISINSNNVISISTAYQQKIAKGEDAYNSISALADRITAIEGWFEVVTVSGQSALHAKSGRAIYSDSWISAGGVGSGGGGGGGVTSLYALDEVLSSTSPSTNQVFYFNGSKWTATALKTVGGTSLIGSGNIPISGGGGTVTSVAMTVPTGLSVSGTPITSSGTLAVSLASGYVIPQQATLDNYVTLAGDPQTISSAKTFTSQMTAANIVPGGTNTLGLSGSRWNKVWAVDEDLSGNLSMASSSHIDIGPLRIEYDANSYALHITKVSSSDTHTYGIYADGFVSAGGVGQSS